MGRVVVLEILLRVEVVVELTVEMVELVEIAEALVVRLTVISLM
jgi:hypothetical protein